LASSFPEKNLGHRIKALEQEQGITLQKLAEQTLLLRSLLSKIENGKDSSPVSPLYLVAQTLGAENHSRLLTKPQKRDKFPTLV
jgi:transcriptional regulator with XRE-family HTH domain